MDEDVLEKHIDEMGTISSSYYRGDYTLEETVAQIERYILISAAEIMERRSPNGHIAAFLRSEANV